MLAAMLFFCSCFGPFDPFNPPPERADVGGGDRPPVSGFPAGLVAWYTCNESEGTTLYDTLGRNNGLIAGCTRDSGISGRALRLNGSGDFVAVNNTVAAFGRGDFTVSVWVKPLIVAQITDTTQHNIISNGVSRVQGFTLSITRNSFTAFVGQYSAVSADTGSPANSGKWMHLALVRSGGTVKLYVENRNVQTYNSESDMNTGNQLLIGRDASSRIDRFYGGLIDEIKLFNTAWDDSDVNREFQRFPH